MIFAGDRGFPAFGGPPRRHGCTQRGKLVRVDPGMSPGTDFEWMFGPGLRSRPRAIIDDDATKSKSALFSRWDVGGALPVRALFSGDAGREARICGGASVAVFLFGVGLSLQHL